MFFFPRSLPFLPACLPSFLPPFPLFLSVELHYVVLSWPGTCYIDQVGLEFTEVCLPCLLCATMPGYLTF